MRRVNEITDSTLWMDFLEKSYSGFYPFFQSWSWGEVQQKLGFRPLRIGIFEESVLTGVAQIVDVRAKRGHYLHVRHGPVLTDFVSQFDDFLRFIIKKAQEEKASFVRISPLIPKEKLSLSFFKDRRFLNAPIHNMDAENCWVLDITKSEAALLSQMRKSHRYLIKKAKHIGLEIIKTTTLFDAEKFLHLYQGFSSKKNFVPHRGIIEELQVLSVTDEAQLLLAQFEGEVIAGVLIDYSGPMAIYHHAASDERFKHIPANYLLLWEAIREAKTRNKKIFNFWGIAPSEENNHPWAGFTRFKTGFGGERKEFLHAMDLPISYLYWKSYAIDLFTKMKKGY